MSNDEEPAPSAAVSENEDDEACSDAEQASRTRKRCKTGLTKCEDEYAVSQRRQALSAKANTGKFLGLRAEKPAKANAAKTTKHSGKDFVYGVLFVTLVAFGAQKPVNRTAKWFCCCTSDCEYFFDLTDAEGKDHSKTSIYRHLQDHSIPKDKSNRRVVKDEQTKCITATATQAIKQLGSAVRYYQILMARTMICRFLPFSFVECGCVRAMMHDDYETQGPRAARSSIGEQFLSSAARVRHLVSTLATEIYICICTCTCCFRNLHMYLYMYMLLFVCDWTEVFFIVCKHRFNPECSLFL
jgi:hypothetical protein